MTEQKVKKRGWVKNAAIIFLAVMLALTFFSNTIMNHSLPEVAASYVQSGSINVKIRGTGTVTANESYEVKSEQSREVLSVPVAVGNEVKVGDTLLYYSDAESSQIQEAQEALEALTLAYKKALINVTDSDYAKETRDIELAQTALDEAKAERDKYYITAQEVSNANSEVDQAKAAVITQQVKVDALAEELAGLSAGGNSASTTAAINAKQTEITAAENALTAAQLLYADAYNDLEDLAKAWIVADGKTTSNTNIEIYMKALYDSFSPQVSAGADPVILPSGAAGTNPTKVEAKTMVSAYKAITDCKDTIIQLKADMSALQASISYGDVTYYSVKGQLADAKGILTSLQAIQTRYENYLTAIEDKQKKYEAAQTSVDTNQKSLQDLMFALAEQKKNDGKTQATEALDLADQRRQLEEKEEELEKLKGGSEGASVESKVNGVVASVNISAGNTAEADAVLMTIEVPDMGYGISFSVTTEQSKKVKVGDAGEVSNYYSGDEITATLVGIKSDPKNPTTNKILNFKLQGEVESGTQLSISIGERGGNYDTIVPNSAIRSDNNGKFVLVVVAKNSPLGNRYIAQRIDVKVLASDDVNSAVSGGLSNSDFVITTSTKPIEPGVQVRMPDSQ